MKTILLFVLAQLVGFGSGAQALTRMFSPPPELLGSPALLADYADWMKAQSAFIQSGSETLLYRDLVDIAYDAEIERPWKPDEYFIEAERRLEAFRSRFCVEQDAKKLSLCSRPQKIGTTNDIVELENSLTEAKLNRTLEARWNLAIETVQLPNAIRRFDLEVSPRPGCSTVAEVSFWNFSPQKAFWLATSPVLSDVDSYLGNFEFETFPAQFALSGGRILLNDWQIRQRAMEFADHWKFEIEAVRGADESNPVTDPVEDQLFQLYRENRALFERTYAKWLARVSGNPEVHARFLKERAAGDFPEEIYQHVAYKLFEPLVQMESAYYELASTQRLHTSDRQKSLEALLTLQRYLPDSRIFLLELESLAAPLMSHATILDQTVNFQVAMTYELENLRAVLDMDDYTGSDGFKRFGYALLDDRLFDSYYLKNNAPEIYRELMKPDGALKSINDVDTETQVQIFRQYLLTPDGKLRVAGVARLAGALFAHIKDADLRELAQRIHQAHVSNFK